MSNISDSLADKMAWSGALVVAVEKTASGQERAVFVGRCERLVTEPMVLIVSPRGEEQWYLQSEVRKLDAPLNTAAILST